MNENFALIISPLSLLEIVVYTLIGVAIVVVMIYDNQIWFLGRSADSIQYFDGHPTTAKGVNWQLITDNWATCKIQLLEQKQKDEGEKNAGPSTSQVAKNAPCFAQDYRSFDLLRFLQWVTYTTLFPP